jgi:hypothetical protein
MLYTVKFLSLLCFISLVCIPSSFLSAVHSDQYLNSRATPHRLVRELLITGCARSGTTYITYVLRNCGLNVDHEENAGYGIVSWPMAVDSSNSVWGPPSNRYRFKHIFHQVRHPLKAIASATTEPTRSWAYICQHCKNIKMHDKPLVKAAKYWYYWNLLAEKKAEWTYRIEDIENALDEMSRRLSIPLSKKALGRISKKTNSRRHASYTWKDIKAAINPKLYAKILEMARRYGYNVDDAA